MNGYTGFAKVFASLVGVSIVSPLSDYFTYKNINILVSMCLAAIISSLIILIIEYIMIDLPYHFLWFRKKVLSIAKMEGTWIEIMEQGERAVCIANISFDYDRKKHVYSGRAYSQDGIIKATWESKHLSGEANNVAFTFIGTGEVISPHQSVRNVGQIEFWSTDPHNRHKLTVGRGVFYDYDAESTVESQNNFLLEKLTPQLYFETTGKKRMKTSEDERNFVIEYYRQNSHMISHH